ncbi:MAG: hypothetical protein V4792_00385 [Pseudomonadota bacterium]
MNVDLGESRRLFLRVSAGAAGSMVLGACGGSDSGEAVVVGVVVPPPAAAPPPAPPGTNVIDADPSNYLGKIAQLRPGDTLLLAPGNYGVDAQGNDTGSVPGLPLFNVNGTLAAPITVSGPASGPMPVLLGRSTHNTVRLSNTSHVVIRRLEVNGRDRGGAGVATQGPSNHITIEDCNFLGFGGNNQIVAISTVGQPTWNWIVRRNLIVGAGTGMYFGNSNGDSPFVNGLIEYNVVRDCLGYCMQIKHQAVWVAVPAGMPNTKTTTVIRHNVFAKAGNSATGDLARPNVLVGDSPPSGPGSSNGFSVYGNFFYQNPTESLFQGEGNVALYANLMVTNGIAVRVQIHNGAVRDVRIFHNTVVAGETGIAVSGGAAGYTQRVLANAIFSEGPAVVLNGALSIDNLSDTRAAAVNYLNKPLASIPSLDLFPKVGALKKTAADLGGLDTFADWNRDFNGNAYDPAWRGAYSGEGTNPGWVPALDQKA